MIDQSDPNAGRPCRYRPATFECDGVRCAACPCNATRPDFSSLSNQQKEAER